MMNRLTHEIPDTPSVRANAAGSDLLYVIESSTLSDPIKHPI